MFDLLKPIKNYRNKKRLEKVRKELEKRLEKERIIREEERIRREEEDKNKFHYLFSKVETYLFLKYEECDINVPEYNYLEIKKDELQFDNIDLDFSVKLDNNINHPTFHVIINYGNEYFNYKISGLNFLTLKYHFIKNIYNYYKSEDYYKKKVKVEKPKEKSKEEKRLDLLKNVLERYKEQYKILINENANMSDINIVINQIKNVQDKITNMELKYGL
jgi:hypothetical protein